MSTRRARNAALALFLAACVAAIVAAMNAPWSTAPMPVNAGEAEVAASGDEEVAPAALAADADDAVEEVAEPATQDPGNDAAGAPTVVEAGPLDLNACMKVPFTEFAACIGAELSRPGLEPEDVADGICRIQWPPRVHEESLVSPIVGTYLKTLKPAAGPDALRRMHGHCELLLKEAVFQDALLFLRLTEPEWYGSFFRTVSSEDVFGAKRSDILLHVLCLLVANRHESRLLPLIESGGRGEHDATLAQTLTCLETATDMQPDADAALTYLDSVIGSEHLQPSEQVARQVAKELLARAKRVKGDVLPRLTLLLTDDRFRRGTAAHIVENRRSSAPWGTSPTAWADIWDLAVSVAQEYGIEVKERRSR